MNLSNLLADLKEGDYVHIKLNNELGTEWAGEISTVSNDGIWIDDNLSERFEFVSYADLKDWERKDILEFALL